MRRTATLFIVGALAGLPSAMAADNGIFVSEPKLYDDYTLEKMLLEAEQSLAMVELIKSDAISSTLGGTQGVQVTQTQLSLTATQLPTPSVVATQSATPSTVTTTPTVTPQVPGLPSVPTLTPPSTITPSAIDKLDEFLQLKLRVSNLRLLLRGSLTDQVSLIGDEVVPQSRFTFGFPVTLTPPAGRFYRDAIAEVEVKVTLDEKCAPQGHPGLKMVLPQEKTYNVAQLRSSATSIGTGVVAGAFSVGGNWLRGQSKLFLVQDQDTLAYEGHSENDRQIVFGWRFKPVLGQRKVQPSVQQLFAQLTFPIPPGAAALGRAEVITRWRQYERKTGALGIPIPGPESSQEFDLKRIDLAPGPVSMQFLDLGNGKVRITLEGGKFFEGTTFRLGGALPIEVAKPTDHVLLDLAPLDIVRQGVLVGVRGEQERLLVNACVDPGRADAVPSGCEKLPSVKRSEGRSTNNCDDPFSGFKITQVTTTPMSQSTSRVRVTLDKLRQANPRGDLKFLTVLGDKVFGLQDAPYETYTPCRPSSSQPCEGVIEFLAENATLEKTGSIEVVRLFWGTAYHAFKELDRARKLVVARSAIVSAPTGGDLRLALQGQGFDLASIKFPTGATFEERGPGHALVFIPAAQAANLKNLVLQMGTDVPVLVDVSSSTPPPTPPVKPVLNPPDPVKIGTGVDVPITWKNEGVIKSVTHNGRIQPVTPLNKNSATIRLEDALTARSGRIELSVTFTDGTVLPLTVQLVDQHVAVTQQ
jgi:hypothetical protein